ncbi:MAG: hypothetical protein JXR73_15210, partial [Candidatus Omnitrophica bacterium]|nr:hypothetical protein [Candidatus Omnitrophota bacterium]
MLRKHLTKCLAIALFIGIGGGFVYAIQNNAPDKVDLLLQAVDSSINALEIKIEMIETHNKFFANQREQQKESMVNSRRQRPGYDVDIAPYEAKVYDKDMVVVSFVDISFLNNKTRVVYDYPAELHDYISFYEPGKMYEICFDGLNLNRKMVTVDNIQKPSILALTSHLFGRGLSQYVGHPKQMGKIEENLYQLTIFSPSQEDKKIAEFILDSRLNYCWTSGRLFGIENEVFAELKASDFREKGNMVFPYTVEETFYTYGEFNHKYQISIQEITSLPEDQNELNVFDDIPANSIICKFM